LGNKKKLIGVYLPLSLIKELKQFILKVFEETGLRKSQSEVIEEALEKYLNKRKPK